jgi:O-antigen ligase
MTVAIDVRASGVPLNKLLYLFYIAGFLFVGGGFVLLTSSADLRLAPEPGAGSLVSQSILAFFYSVGTVLLLVNVHAARVFKGAWPVLLLPLLALISVTWSADPSLSLRRAIAFCGTILFGISLGAAYASRDLIGLITRSMLVACAFSCAVVVVAPHYGVHQPSDAIQAVHAGLWRGIFGHRNTLGLWAGLTVASLCLFGRYTFKGILWRTLSLLLGLACLVGANSGAGYAICATTLLIGVVLIGFVGRPTSHRGLYVFIAVFGAIIFFLLRDTFETLTLHLLGKNSDLTGRTLLWYYILQITEKNNFLLGGGYFVGFVALNTEIGAILQTTFGSAHNGYLETLVYMGYVGLAVCIVVLAWYSYRAARRMLDHTDEPSLRILPLTFISVVAIHNFVESTIILPNNLNALLLSIVAGTLALADEGSTGGGR